MIWLVAAKMRAISILAPARGGDMDGASIPHFSSYFNSRPREGGDYSAYVVTDDGKYISILAPARGATGNQRLRRNKTPISILAPARGATCGLNGEICEYPISILAPARGATGPAVGRWQATLFQFSPPRGGRPEYLLPDDPGTTISILAPARGATFRAVFGTVSSPFQFSPPRGGRHGAGWYYASMLLFQFSPPRGGRRTSARAQKGCSNFNSRPREGGDGCKGCKHLSAI